MATARRRRRRSALFPVVAALGITAVSPLALADPPAENAAVAQAMFDDAKQLVAAGSYTEACPKLEESQRLDPKPGTLFNLADCYERLGRTASAWSVFLEVAGAARSAGHPEHEALARERAAAVAAKLSKLSVAVSPTADVAGLRVERDGVDVGRAAWGSPLPVDPGNHSIVANAPGRMPWRTTVQVPAGGAHVTITVPPLADLNRSDHAAGARPTPGTPSRTGDGQRIAAYIAGGAGIIGLGVGTYFGVRSIEDHNEARNHCHGKLCDPQGVELTDGAIGAGNASTVAFAAGTLALGVGLVLWLAAPSSPKGAQRGIVRPGVAAELRANAGVLRGSW